MRASVSHHIMKASLSPYKGSLHFFLLEIVGYYSVGADAFWRVNPDHCGYIIAIVMLFPFSLVMAVQVFGFKLIKYLPVGSRKASVTFKVMTWVGCAVAVLASIQVVLNFLFAVCTLVFFLWMCGQKSYYKDTSGNIYESNITGMSKLHKEAADEVKNITNNHPAPLSQKC